MSELPYHAPAGPIRVYVASSFKNLAEVREVMSRLRAAGYEIAHDWTRDSDEGLQGEERLRYLAACAEKDLRAVRECDVFFLVNDDRGRGCFTELGIALALGKPVYVAKSGAAANVFLLLPDVQLFDTTAEALAALGAK